MVPPFEMLQINLDEGQLLVPLRTVAELRANVQAQADGCKPHSKLWERYAAEAVANPSLAIEWVLNHLDFDEISAQARFIPNSRFLGCLWDGFHSADQVDLVRNNEKNSYL